MTHAWVPLGASLGHDERVPALDLSPDLTYRSRPRRRAAQELSHATVAAAVSAARWPGQVLSLASVLGSLVYPVVAFTGAAERVRRRQPPILHLETLDVWETMPSAETPPAPVRIVGFVSTAAGWSTALDQVRSLSGLGAGMVLRRRPSPALPLMDADATGVWVAGIDPAESVPRVWVTGRSGPASTASRVAATRLMEEGLFAHALACNAIS